MHTAFLRPVPFALALLATGAVRLAQTPCKVEHTVLGSSVQGLELWAPDGAAVLKGPFSLQVRDGLPGAIGILALGFVENPTYQPLFDVILYPKLPALQLPFAFDGAGASPKLVQLAWLDPVFCGLPLIAQAAAADVSATGGWAFSNGLRVVAGDVAGPYLPASIVPTGGTYGGAIATGDFNGDAHADLAVRGNHGGDTSILLGNGDATFEHAGFVVPGENYSFLEAVDVDGDGELDLVDMNYDSFTGGTLFVFSGGGDGSFGPAQVVESFYPEDLDVGDMNGDGFADLLVLDDNIFELDLNVMLNQGDGTFQPSVSYPAGLVPLASTVSDFDLDGALDVLVSSNSLSSNWVRIFRGAGDGTLLPAEMVSPDDSYTALLAGDLDQDGLPDFVGRKNYDVEVYRGLGDGSFTDGVEYEIGSWALEVALSDLDNDGDPELLGARVDDDELVILHAEVGATFGPASRYSVGGDLFPSYGIVAVDVDSDDVRDVLVSVSYQGSGLTAVEVLIGDGQAGLRAAVEVPSVTAEAAAVAVDDLDGDGRGDFVVAGAFEATVHLSDGAGSFQVLSSIDTGGTSLDVDVSDLDLDGTLDLIFANGAEGSASTALGLGVGLFQSPNAYAAGGEARSLATGDFDGNGIPDAAIALATENIVGILLGDGAGGFGAPDALPTAPWPEAALFDLVLEDFDLNGTVDVLAVHAGTDAVYLFSGKDDGTFAAPTAVAAGGLGFAPSSLAKGDLDLDGNPDLATANVGANSVSVMRGNGDGTFAAAEVHALGQTLQRVAIADVDGNGNPELVVLHEQFLSVLPGGPGATPGPTQHYSVPGLETAADLALDDLDGDGIRDILVLGGGGRPFLLSNLIGE